MCHLYTEFYRRNRLHCIHTTICVCTFVIGNKSCHISWFSRLIHFLYIRFLALVRAYSHIYVLSFHVNLLMVNACGAFYAHDKNRNINVSPTIQFCFQLKQSLGLVIYVFHFSLVRCDSFVVLFDFLLCLRL